MRIRIIFITVAAMTSAGSAAVAGLAVIAAGLAARMQAADLIAVTAATITATFAAVVALAAVAASLFAPAAPGATAPASPGRPQHPHGQARPKGQTAGCGQTVYRRREPSARGQAPSRVPGEPSADGHQDHRRAHSDISPGFAPGTARPPHRGRVPAGQEPGNVASGHDF